MPRAIRALAAAEREVPQRSWPSMNSRPGGVCSSAPSVARSFEVDDRGEQAAGRDLVVVDGLARRDRAARGIEAVEPHRDSDRRPRSRRRRSRSAKPGPIAAGFEIDRLGARDGRAGEHGAARRRIAARRRSRERRRFRTGARRPTRSIAPNLSPVRYARAMLARVIAIAVGALLLRVREAVAREHRQVDAHRARQGQAA